MICMAYEIIAEQAEAAIEDPESSTRFWLDTIKELEKFMHKWEKQVDLDSLNFLANLQPLRSRFRN